MDFVLKHFLHTELVHARKQQGKKFWGNKNSSCMKNERDPKLQTVEVRKNYAWFSDTNLRKYYA